MHVVWEMYHWLIVDGDFWHAVVTFTVGFTFARVLAWRPLKKIHASQKAIQDALDTSTPGGLTSVVGAINKLHSSIPIDNNSSQT